jgi:secondary thiamine-phosphate synthase enzyme
MIHQTLSVTTTKRNEMISVTQQVQAAIMASGISSGVVTLFVPHTTAAVTINENADPDVPRDMLLALQRISPVLREFHHGEGNSDAHVKSSLVGCSLQVVVQDGRLQLGTWQGIWFCEFDGPRSRRLECTMMQG